MTEIIGQDPVAVSGEAPTIGLDEAFKIIGKLAKRAAQGDKSARSTLQMLEKQQLAEIQGLKDELALVTVRDIMSQIARNTL